MELRNKILARYRNEFEREEQQLLALKQPWQYYHLAIMYEIIELLDCDIELDNHVLEQFDSYSLGELEDKVSDIIDNMDDREPIWSIVKETMERSDR